ncbi:hypothetical protein [Streptomyces sp. NBC_01446]|uniref:hypothetical protein n=1 Tax=Streptomyces sp. NBC_01446 TaxID=2903870 RepID=UPI00225A5942|nr:hypothetical protein [Streptomyces sp. NBC_01446]MCX4642248.1 hypothetical protein [Streptomyces sp. NBC_01446]
MLAYLGMVLGTLLVGAHIAVVVGIVLVIVCVWAALAKRIHIDPAVVSAPSAEEQVCRNAYVTAASLLRAFPAINERQTTFEISARNASVIGNLVDLS